MKSVESAKKILALSCSPSKGRNSDTMLDNFISAASKYDSGGEFAEIEKVHLNDIPFDLYNYENGKHPAEHEVEFVALMKKFCDADGIIIATPTYNFSVPAQLKNFIDRIRYVALDLNKRDILGQPVGLLKKQKFFFLVSGGTPKWAQRILFFAFPPFWLRGVFLYYGANYVDAYYSGDIRSFENPKILKKCQKYGKKFAKAVIHDKGEGILDRIFWKPRQRE